MVSDFWTAVYKCISIHQGYNFCLMVSMTFAKLPSYCNQYEYHLQPGQDHATILHERNILAFIYQERLQTDLTDLQKHNQFCKILWWKYFLYFSSS